MITFTSYPIPRRPRTSAQKSNFFPLTALLYEDLWRKRSLGILSRQPFPIRQELALLREWLSKCKSGTILDVGCSTGLYARALASEFPSASVTAVDMSKPMLKEARKRATREGVNVSFVLADAIALPFEEGQFGALAMGGTLNELGPDTEIVLKECGRVLKKDGLFFMMYLLKSEKKGGRFLQSVLKSGGLRFWSAEEAKGLFSDAGLEQIRFQHFGVVAFSLLRKL